MHGQPRHRPAQSRRAPRPCRLQTASLTAAWHLQLHKDRRTRAEEERLVGRLLLNVVAEACQLADRLHLDLLEGEHVKVAHRGPAGFADLLLGKVDAVRQRPSP